MKTLKNPIHYCNQRTKNLEHPCKYYSQNNLKSKHIKNLKFLKFTHTFSFCLFCSPPLSLSSCSLLLSFFLYTVSTFKSFVGGSCFLFTGFVDGGLSYLIRLVAVGELESQDSYVLSQAGAVGLKVLSFTLFFLFSFFGNRIGLGWGFNFWLGCRQVELYFCLRF